MIDKAAICAQFPGLAGQAHGHPFVYLDSAATAQKPLAVIERMDRFLRDEYGTVHRGLYQRSVRSTALYEEARREVARFLGARPEELVFTMGTTDAINLVSNSWGRSQLGPGDQVLCTALEHHAGIVPWQLVCQATGAELLPIPVDDAANLDLAAYRQMLARGRVKMVQAIHVANSVGTVMPVAEMARLAHAAGALILVDAAQSVPHRPIDVRALDCDFLVCSAHKCYGPTGIGALWGRAEILAGMPPWRGGGEMIERVSFSGTTFREPPARFEAGTPPITEVIGFAAACRWLMDLGMEAVAAHEGALFVHAEALLDAIPNLRRIGRAAERATVLSYVPELPGASASDLGALLDMQGIAIRVGHHCAQPVMDRFGVSATARISLGVYTSEADIEAVAAALRKALAMLAG